MVRESALQGRANSILRSVVKCYIGTGEPVASRTVAQSWPEALSSATVRNLMAELEEAGYLEQPHTSAGRIPTEKAFRLYVQSLMGGKLPPLPANRFRTELSEADSQAGRVERCCHLLSEFTRNVGIAVAIPTAAQTLDRVELLKLSDRRVLVVLITRDGTVRHRVMWLEAELRAEEMVSICAYLNENFSGWVLADARRELEARLRVESAAYDAILSRLLELCGKGLLAVDADAEVHLEGAANLVAVDLRITRRRMQELLRALEEKRRILELLDRFLEQPAGELGVQVGLAEVHPSMKELALIGVNVLLPGGLRAKIAVLGPLRMNYERVMAAVWHMGSTLGSLPC